MSSTRKSKKRKSITTPGHLMAVRNSLTELMMFRSFFGKLPAYFWRDTRWKWRYTQEVKAISKFIKKYGEDLVAEVIIKNYITTAKDYSNLEVLLQREMDRISRLLRPKDTSKMEAEVDEEIKDLRESRPSVCKKSLFERLSDIERNINA